MCIHLHTICLIGVTELGTVTCHFAPNRRRFHWSIFRWMLLCRKNIFSKKWSLSLFVPSFRFFSTFRKHDVTVLVIISHGNRLTSYLIYSSLPVSWCAISVRDREKPTTIQSAIGCSLALPLYPSLSLSLSCCVHGHQFHEYSPNIHIYICVCLCMYIYIYICSFQFR